MSVQFKDFSIKVEKLLEENAVAFLEEAAGEIEAEAKRTSPYDTGEMFRKWNHEVDDEKLEAVVGNPLEYAIWNEYGTGEYALEGNGRKGGWSYTDKHGERHFTFGQKPKQTLTNAFEKLKPRIIKRANKIFKEGM